MDKIANMLISIKNAQLAGRTSLKIPFSNLKFSLAKIFKKEGFVEEVEQQTKVERDVKNKKDFILIKLKYEQGRPAIQGVKRISKLGQRRYFGHREIKSVRQGYGLAIISTSQGLMTGQEAKKKKIGGEILCEVW